MNFIDHGAGGPAACMQLKEGSLPRPASGEVLIAVAYAGVNRADLLQRAGKYPPPIGASPLIGLEVAGTVVALGKDAQRWQVGDEVCALTAGGGYSQYCVAPAEHCLPIPDGCSLAEAASLPESYFTVWTNIFERGRLQAGESLLVHGGSSGIGVTAIQLARAAGATVLTTVGSATKVKAVTALGADIAIDYREEDWVAKVDEFTAGKGVDCILDMVGGSYVAKNLQCLAVEGRLVQIGFMQPSRVEIDCRVIVVKRLTFTGSALRPMSIREKAAIAHRLESDVWPLFPAGKTRAVIHATFPLADARLAHDLMEASTHIGKILLQCADVEPAAIGDRQPG